MHAGDSDHRWNLPRTTDHRLSLLTATGSGSTWSLLNQSVRFIDHHFERTPSVYRTSTIKAPIIRCDTPPLIPPTTTTCSTSSRTRHCDLLLIEYLKCLHPHSNSFLPTHSVPVEKCPTYPSLFHANAKSPLYHSRSNIKKNPVSCSG